MKILGIDSSGLVASVAVVEDDVMLGEYTMNYKKTHSQTLLPMLDELSKMIELDMSTIDAIAVAGGPGSFTGLRIGSATAKGLGLALDKPIISIPTVDGLAFNMWGSRNLVCPIMDARRNQTYTGLYEFTDEGMNVLIEQCAVDISEIIQCINEKQESVTFLGDGVAVFKDTIEKECKVPYTFAPAHMNKQRAGAVASLGFIYMQQGKCEDAAAHRPDYLRLSQAERERMEHLKEEKKVIIREAVEADIEQMARIEMDNIPNPWSLQGFADALQQEHVIMLVASANDEVVGYCVLYMAADEGEIPTIAVREDMTRRHIASDLLEQIAIRAAAHNVSQVYLEVRESNTAARELYRTTGFIGVGVRKEFYQNPKEDAIVMEKLL